MPEMDEGAFVLDYNMPVGTSLGQTDKVLRRVEAVLQRDARHLGLHPPHRRRARASSPPSPTPATSWSASSRPASAGRRARSSMSLREELKEEVPELETEFVPLVLDQINDLAGVDEPDRGQGLRPRLRPSSASWPSRSARSSRKIEGRGRRQLERPAGQPRHRDPSRQCADGPRRPDRAGRREPAQRRALRPGGQHDSRSRTG